GGAPPAAAGGGGASGSAPQRRLGRRSEGGDRRGGRRGAIGAAAPAPRGGAMRLIRMWWPGLVLALLSLARPASATPLDPFAGALPWERLAAAHPGDWAKYAMRTGEGTTGP